MKDKDIELLKQYFTKAGEENRRHTEVWTEQAAECLRKAGASDIIVDHQQGNIMFQVPLQAEKGKKICYRLRIAAGSRQIWLAQKSIWEQAVRAGNLMGWYADRRNKSFSGNMRYSLAPVFLEGKILLRSGWEKELIRRVGEMNRVIAQDYDIFDAMDNGSVPEIIREKVRQEYREYEREIENDISI